MHQGYVWPEFTPRLGMRLPALEGAGPTGTLDVELTRWEGASGALEVRLTRPDGVVASGVLDDESGTLSFALPDLSAPSALEADERLLVSGAILTAPRSARLARGMLLAAVSGDGPLVIEGAHDDVMVFTDAAVGGQAQGRASLVVPELHAGDVIAAVERAVLDASGPAAVYETTRLESLDGADAVLVLGTAGLGVDGAEAAVDAYRALHPEREVASLTLAEVRALFPGTSTRAALGALAEAVADDDGEPTALVLVGSAAGSRALDVPMANGLWVPGGLVALSHTALGDGAYARDADGAPRAGVVVTRWPVPSVADLESLVWGWSSTDDGGAGPLVVTDPSGEFGALGALTLHALDAGGVTASFVDGEQTGKTGTTAALLGALDQGARSVWYAGHGSALKLTLGNGDALRRALKGSSTTLVALACLVGNDLWPGGADRFSRRLFVGDGGAFRAAVLGSGMLDVGSHGRFGEALADAFTVEPSVGAAYALARTLAFSGGADADVLDAYVLFGDPFAPSR